MSRIIIVDEQDKIIGYKERTELDDNDDMIRAAGLFVYNSKNEVLLARRALSKKHSPGKWGPAVAGTVEEGETYESNIVKEAQEEIGLGITESDLQLLPNSYRLVVTSHRYFEKGFVYRCDWPAEKFVIQPTEVASVRWVPIHELPVWMKEKPEDFMASVLGADSPFYKLEKFLLTKNGGPASGSSVVRGETSDI